MVGREATGIAIEVGDVLQLNAWSRIQSSFRAMIRVRPASGGKPFSIPIDVTASSGGVVLTGTGSKTIDSPGVIDEVMISNVPKAGDTAIGSRGEAYVQLMLLNGGCLSCGYVYPGHNPSLNELVEPGPTGGRGWRKRQALTQPAAGANYADTTVATGEIWKVWSVQTSLTTSAVAGNRQPQIFIDDGVNEIMRGTSSAQPASLGKAHEWEADTSLQENNAGATIKNALPWQQLLVAGDRIRFATPAIDVGDQWAAGGIYLEEWVVPF